MGGSRGSKSEPDVEIIFLEFMLKIGRGDVEDIEVVIANRVHNEAEYSENRIITNISRFFHFFF